MKINKVTTIRELDLLIPHIMKLHSDIGLDKYVSLSEYLAWLTIQIPNTNFGIWYGDEDGEIIGYLVAQIATRYLHNECNIVDAYMTKVDTGITDEFFTFIERWAKDHGCEILSCNTLRPGIARKYDFDNLGTVLMKFIDI